METWLAVTRALHFAAAIALFGQFVFIFVLSAGRRRATHFGAVAAWSIGVAFASALAWLALEAANMSGLPLDEALTRQTLATVVTKTVFGRVWLARMVMIAVLIGVMVAARRPMGPRGRTSLDTLGFIAALVFLASLAGMGHAQAGTGGDRIAHLLSDAFHLVAAGAWLGALLPLIRSLGDALPQPGRDSWDEAASATRRFSGFGVAAMATVLLTGIVNATYAIDAWRALLHTPYGALLVAKVLLFAAILGIAGVNRFRLTPRLMGPSNASGVAALAALRRNAVVEMILGVAIIAIVGKLGITMPAMHSGMP